MDFAACDLAELNGASDVQNVYFPFGKTKESFVNSAKEKLKKVSKVARDHIHGLSPYRGGNELLWLIHYLDLGDKHRRLTPIGMAGTTGAKFDSIGGDGSGGSFGIRMARPHWVALDKGMRVATIQKGTVWDGEFNANITVAFGQVESIAHRPLQPLMEGMIHECGTVLAGIRSSFF